MRIPRNLKKHTQCFNNISCTNSRPMSKTAYATQASMKRRSSSQSRYATKVKEREMFSRTNRKQGRQIFVEKSVASHSSWCCQADCFTQQTHMTWRLFLQTAWPWVFGIWKDREGLWHWSETKSPCVDKWIFFLYMALNNFHTKWCMFTAPGVVTS